jgi:hypothetical protein
MENFEFNDSLENLKMEDIDVIEMVDLNDESVTDISSNTNWRDTSLHIMHNGVKMNCP